MDYLQIINYNISMKILIYLGHPAQYHFYKHIIQRLNHNGHKVAVLLKTKDILQDLVGNVTTTTTTTVEYINIQKKIRKYFI